MEKIDESKKEAECFINTAKAYARCVSCYKIACELLKRMREGYSDAVDEGVGVQRAEKHEVFVALDSLNKSSNYEPKKICDACECTAPRVANYISQQLIDNPFVTLEDEL